jgi:glycosyltransferase involved in cell wall biosynthesis
MNCENPLVSVIIPCYNQGIFIEETLNSVLASTYKKYEVIIVNDGSTDLQTNKLLNSIKYSCVNVIHTANQGLAMARNTGISHSHGKYILPLDADDKISHEFLEEAVNVLESNQEVNVVSCDVRFFDKRSGLYRLPEYSFKKILGQNILVASCFFRREDFDKTSGYDSKLIYGYEDWDFWLSLLGENGVVYKIPKVHFFYRIKKSSMISELRNNKIHQDEMIDIIFRNHNKLFSKYCTNPALTMDYYKVYNSMEYRLGRALLKPIRIIINLYKNIL